MTSGAGISVSELNQIIIDTLHREYRLRNVVVTAEISGFKNHFASGHWYFSLKDENAAIPCVMFRQNNTTRAALRPKDGDLVTVTGYVEMYARDGRVQLYVTEMKPAGLGSLYEQFEALKQKLSAEGLFDPGRKRTLPRIPKKVAVITSASGAALHDILNVSGQRSPGIPIVLVPSAVQGSDAGRELARAIEKAAKIPEVDAIIIGRGGGSAEDLWCFNDEGLARAIAACPIPVVSGVGHEVDFTICDYVADVRASTPSNAVEIVFPDRDELRGQVQYLRGALLRAENERIHAAQLRLMEKKERLQRLSPDQTIHRLLDTAHQRSQRLERVMTLALREKAEQLAQKRTRLCYGMERAWKEREFALQRAETRLNAISPLKVLDRGYALIYDTEGSVIPDASTAGKHSQMKIRFRDGEIIARREEKE